MRAGILGLLAKGDKHLIELVNASTRITHTDSRAIEGALIIAKAARFARENSNRNPIEFVENCLTWLQGKEILDRFGAIKTGLENGQTPQEYVDANCGAKGVSGYINNTVPAAIYAWAATPDDFQKTIETCVLFGGDTDSVAAIAGSVSGAGVGSDRLPAKWIEQLGEWPRDVEWMRHLSRELCHLDQVGSPAPSMRWGRTAIRNFLFAVTFGCFFRFLTQSPEPD
jgi:ADP-ribosylglycohydrolase